VSSAVISSALQPVTEGAIHYTLLLWCSLRNKTLEEENGEQMLVVFLKEGYRLLGGGVWGSIESQQNKH